MRPGLESRRGPMRAAMRFVVAEGGLAVFGPFRDIVRCFEDAGPGSLELDRSRGGRAPDNAAKARHRPTTDRAQMQSHAPGDRPAPPLQGRTNKTAVLDPAPTDPSWPVPAADRVNVRESLFAEAFNRLLQQNRHRTDTPTLLSEVRCCPPSAVSVCREPASRENLGNSGAQ
jgi:hypothetical protein